MKKQEEKEEVYERSDLDNEIISMIEDSFEEKLAADRIVEFGRMLMDQGVELCSPDGVQKIGSKVLHQCVWRIMSKVKFLGFKLQSPIRSDRTERITTAGFQTIVDNGGLNAVFRDKGGAFHTLFLEGDAFVWMGANPLKVAQKPLKFRIIPTENVFYRRGSLGIRGVQPTPDLVVIDRYPKDVAYEMYPKLKAAGVYGRIPGSYNAKVEDETKDEEFVEFAHYYNPSRKIYAIRAGVQMFEVDTFEGEEYGCAVNGEPDFPVFQFICQPSVRKFRNYGLYGLVGDLAIITAKMLNMQATHTINNILPVTFVNLPADKTDELMFRMAEAYGALDEGKYPIVPMEMTPGSSTGISAQTIQTQGLVSEWQAVWDSFTREISRLGILLDDVDRGAGYTRGQVYAEEEAAGSWVKQVMEYNASETKALVDSIMSYIVEYVSTNNKTLINSPVRLTASNGNRYKVQEAPTLGMLAAEIKEGKYYAEIDARSGKIPSDLSSIMDTEQLMSMAPPGSPEAVELFRRRVSLSGIDLSDEPQQGGAPQASGQTEAPTQGMLAQVSGATETDRTVLPPTGMDAQVF